MKEVNVGAVAVLLWVAPSINGLGTGVNDHKQPTGLVGAVNGDDAVNEEPRVQNFTTKAYRMDAGEEQLNVSPTTAVRAGVLVG